MQSYTNLTAAWMTGRFEFRQLQLCGSRCRGGCVGKDAAVGLGNVIEYQQRITKIRHKIATLNVLFLKWMSLLWKQSQMLVSGRTDIRDQFLVWKLPLLDKCRNMDSYMTRFPCTVLISGGGGGGGGGGVSLMCTVPLQNPQHCPFHACTKLQVWKRSCLCSRCVDKSVVVRIKIQWEVCWATKSKINLRSQWILPVFFSSLWT